MAESTGTGARYGSTDSSLATKLGKCRHRTTDHYSRNIRRGEYRRGTGRYTPRAHGTHLEIAKGSAAETDSWSDTLRREGHISVEEDAAIHAACMEVTLLLKIKILDLEKLEQPPNRKLREIAEDYLRTLADDEPSFPFTAEDYI